MGIFRLLLIFALVFFAFRLINIIRQVYRIRNQARAQQFRSTRKEGDVTINVGSVKKEKQFKKTDGDYVDYEEMK